MIKDITLGQYIPGTSPLHRMDPRSKVILTIAYVVGIFLVQGAIGYVLTAALVLLCSKISGISFRYLLKGLKSLLFIIIFTAVINLFIAGGEDVLVKLGFLKITGTGVKYALHFSFRLIFLVLGTSLLTLTTSPIALTDAMERLLSPLRVIHFPAHELAMMMTIALRFIPTLLEETDKIMKAQSARGADFESGNLLARVKAMVPLLVPLFVSAFPEAV